MIARNILANAIGGSWFAILSLAIIPVQVRVLGVDAYGLIAFVASLQILFGIFDLGLTPTISRELATDDSPHLTNSLAIVQVFFVAYVAVGVVLGGGIALTSGWIASHWLDIGSLSQETARSALQYCGIAIMLRWPVSFLAGILVGRGKFALLNLTKSIVATVTLAGGAVIILVAKDLVTYTAWVAIAAFIEVLSYFIICTRCIPFLSFRPRFSRVTVSRIWKFVASVSAISALGTVLAQSDRIVLSRLVTIESLGYYSLASSILMGITLIQTFFTTALLPSFAASFKADERKDLERNYSRASQLLVFICALPVFILAFFGEPMLAMVLSSESAYVVAKILPVLGPAFLINAFVSIPFILSLAADNTSIILKVYGSAVIIYIPLLILFVKRWGIIGAASAWLMLNVSYLFTLVPLAQKRIIDSSVVPWISRNLLSFMTWGALCFAVARFALWRFGLHDFWEVAAALSIATVIYVVVGTKLLEPAIQRDILHAFSRSLPLRRVVSR